MGALDAGALVYVSGQLKSEKWTPKDGPEKREVFIDVWSVLPLEAGATLADAATAAGGMGGRFDDEDLPF